VIRAVRISELPFCRNLVGRAGGKVLNFVAKQKVGKFLKIRNFILYN